MSEAWPLSLPTSVRNRLSVLRRHSGPVPGVAPGRKRLEQSGGPGVPRTLCLQAAVEGGNECQACCRLVFLVLGWFFLSFQISIYYANEESHSADKL